MTALPRIQRAGFEVSLSGDSFTVSPASRLTKEQREFLKTHKAEIVKELSANDSSDTHQTSEAEHNTQGRFFKFLINRPDGTQFYSCAMPRQTLAETQAQFPDITKIEPIENEDYPNDE
jgi:uncharacterized protein YpuA (DUF1002 family)